VRAHGPLCVPTSAARPPQISTVQVSRGSIIELSTGSIITTRPYATLRRARMMMYAQMKYAQETDSPTLFHSIKRGRAAGAFAHKPSKRRFRQPPPGLSRPSTGSTIWSALKHWVSGATCAPRVSANDSAASRAQSMKRSTRGLKVRFFRGHDRDRPRPDWQNNRQYFQRKPLGLQARNRMCEAAGATISNLKMPCRRGGRNPRRFGADPAR
jgi:hypothetical protein